MKNKKKKKKEFWLKEEKKIKNSETDFFVGDYFLKSFINTIDLSDKRKNFLLAKLPELGEEERKSLLVFLKDIYLSDPEYKKIIDKVVKDWKES